MTLSIIVPVYNTEKYIVRCIDSLLRQDFDDYEVILVNDGTTDRALETLQEHVDSDKIIIRNQEHGGQSLARNEGMKMAGGDYVWFIDSDDWVEENCLKEICASLDGCDILYFNQYYESGDSADSAVIKENNANTGKELCKQDVMVGPPFYIYRRAFLIERGLSFAEGLFHEDNLFTPIALYNARSVKPYNKPVYHKYTNPSSTTRTLNPKRCYDLMVIAERLSRFANDWVSENDRWAWGHFIADTMNGALALSQQCDKSVKNDLEAFFRSHPELFDYLCHARKIPTRIMGLLAKNLHIPLVRLYGLLYIIRYQVNR